MFSGADRTSLGSVIRIPERDADVSQEADDLLNVLDRLIAETKGAMVEGLTPTRGGEDSGRPTSPSSTDSKRYSDHSDHSDAKVVEDPRGRIMKNVTPVLVQRDGRKTTEEQQQQQQHGGSATTDDTLQQAVEQLQAALQYRDSHLRHSNEDGPRSDGQEAMNMARQTMTDAYRAKVTQMVASPVESTAGRSKRLERALIAMWQLYGDSKDGAGRPSSSRHSERRTPQRGRSRGSKWGWA